MISTHKKFIFIHVPKTGGNSVQSVLSKYADDRIIILNERQDGIERFGIKNDKFPSLKKHSTLAEYLEELGEDKFKQYYKFTTMRNPWEMVVSFYFSPHRGNVKWSKKKFINLINTIPTFSTYISIIDTNYQRSRNNQLSIHDNINFIMKFEKLQEDFDAVCKALDIEKVTLPRRNQSNREYYSRYYDDETIQIVHEKFHETIKWGDYKFEVR